MIHLILAILCSTAIFVVMRLFKRFELDNHQALAWNYAMAAGLGTLMSALNGPITFPASEPWFPLSLVTGFWFILSYVLMTVSSQQSGVTITSLSSKLSVVIPTLFGVIILKEQLGTIPAIGIVLALVALILVVGKEQNHDTKSKFSFLTILLPVSIFFCTGIGDVLTLIEKAQNTVDEEQAREMARKMQDNSFDLNDLMDQLQQIQKMGPLKQVLGMLPGVGSQGGSAPDVIGIMRKVGYPLELCRINSSSALTHPWAKKKEAAPANWKQVCIDAIRRFTEECAL